MRDLEILRLQVGEVLGEQVADWVRCILLYTYTSTEFHMYLNTYIHTYINT